MIGGVPVQPTMFIGREEELAGVQRYLLDPGCRLLTIIGPGGAGKTRLAIQAGTCVEGHFEKGGHFISLQSVETVDHAVSAIFDSLNIPLAGKDTPRSQLTGYLRDKNILLILDNLDQLSDGAALVSDLVLNAPAVKVLVTSRQTLQLQEEWLYPLSGMDYPREEVTGNAGAYSAASFFAACAQRLRPDFSLEAEQTDVFRICRLVEGLPLALEMAASWVNSLSCAGIADEIQRDIDFLRTQLRNTAPHHQSMQAVIEQSWKRLQPEEQAAIIRLSIFPGGFDLRAARAVADAGPAILSGLVDQSLLQLEIGNRYHTHPLIRQYAGLKLARSPEAAIESQDRFGSYFIAFIHSLEEDLIAGRQREAMLAIKREIENIRKAWNWAVSTGSLESIEKSVMALSLFYQYQGRYLEGNAMLEDAETALKQLVPSLRRDLVLISVLCELGWLRIRLGKIELAASSLNESMVYLNKHQVRPVLANRFDPRLPLGVIASIHGDYTEAARLGEAVLAESRARGEIWNEQLACYLLTRAAILRGDYETARSFGQKTYGLAKANRDQWFMAYALIELGGIALAQGDIRTARTHFQASYELREHFQDPEGMAVALNHLGEVALIEMDFQQAHDYFQKGREIYREINDPGGLAVSLNGLARLALMEGDFVEARNAFLSALDISSQLTFRSLTLAILTGIALLLLKVEEEAEAARILSFVEAHPASERETAALARETVRQHKLSRLDDSAEISSLTGYVTHLSVWLPALEFTAFPDPARTSRSQPLIDPLTERELEVLALIAAGLTNRQIAETLVISPGTAKWYTSQIYSKLGVRNRTRAVARARELEIIS